MSGDGGDLVRLLAARSEAQDALTRVFVCADRRDWDGLRAVLGQRVVLDYTSLSGGDPAELSGDELLAAWRGALGGYEVTQHLLGSFLIETISLSQARLGFYAIATHVLHAGHGDSTWTVAGHYDAVMH
ncbi:MAG: nuclear transport factor 2 family protein, partial [Solirubrobacteraceae bacterium]